MFYQVSIFDCPKACFFKDRLQFYAWAYGLLAVVFTVNALFFMKRDGKLLNWLLL
jgi:hypothetical protein